MGKSGSSSSLLLLPSFGFLRVFWHFHQRFFLPGESPSFEVPPFQIESLRLLGHVKPFVFGSKKWRRGFDLGLAGIEGGWLVAFFFSFPFSVILLTPLFSDCSSSLLFPFFSLEKSLELSLRISNPFSQSSPGQTLETIPVFRSVDLSSNPPVLFPQFP